MTQARREAFILLRYEGLTRRSGGPGFWAVTEGASSCAPFTRTKQFVRAQGDGGRHRSVSLVKTTCPREPARDTGVASTCPTGFPLGSGRRDEAL